MELELLTFNIVANEPAGTSPLLLLGSQEIEDYRKAIGLKFRYVVNP
jgi:hypothetical protein